MAKSDFRKIVGKHLFFIRNHPKNVIFRLFSKDRVMTPRWKSFGAEIKNFEKIYENFHIGPILGPKGARYGPKQVKIDFLQSIGS